MKKKLHIQFKRWDYRCSDGCCYDDGTYIIVNGETLEHPDGTEEEYRDNSYVGDDPIDTLRAVLKHIGIEHEIEEVIDYE